MDTTSANFANSHFREWSSSFDKSLAITITITGTVVYIMYAIIAACEHPFRQLEKIITSNRWLIHQSKIESWWCEIFGVLHQWKTSKFTDVLMEFFFPSSSSLPQLFIDLCRALCSICNLKEYSDSMCVYVPEQLRVCVPISCMLSHIFICFYRTLLNVNHVFPGYCMLAIFIRRKSGIEWSKCVCMAYSLPEP